MQKGNKEKISQNQNQPKKDGIIKGKIKNFKNLKKGPQPFGFFNNLTTTILIIFTIVLLYSFVVETQTQPEEISISQLAQDIRSGSVQDVVVRGDQVEAKYKSDTDVKPVKITKKEEGTALSDTLANYGVSADNLSGVNIKVQNETGFGYWLAVLGPFILPLIIVVFLIWYFMRQVKGASMQAFTFGQSNARLMNPADKSKVTFKDVAGAKEAKEELAEIVDFLKNPKKFIEIGARIPKGILLMGAPGTGKTLLARATAGEAGVAFFSISGSEFVEMFVGVGASRVRDLFRLAKTAAPAIIFIDEIDAVGRARGVGIGGGNDEREQTLNQILVEMDGFEPNEKVIVMAATNRPDVLDPAILRPGRFDRRVTIDLPDRSDREAILMVQAGNKPLAEDVNFRLIAERTPGFSGADLYSLVNEAAILAARENRTKVAQFDLIRSIEKVMLGPERKSHLLTAKERKITAYHEAGHALVASLLPNSDPIHKISIVARGRAGGYTLKLPSEDRKLQSRKEFLDDLAMTLGGYAAEEMTFGDITTGPSNDLQVVTATARDMVARYGMSDKIGPIAFDSSRGRTMFGRGVEDREYSEEIGNEIDKEVSRIINDALNCARTLLAENKKSLDLLSNKLIEKETIEKEEYERFLESQGIQLPKSDENLDKKEIDIVEDLKG